MQFKNSMIVADTVALADRLGAWLRLAGFEESGVAVDFADTVAAARHVDQILSRLILLRPDDPVEAETILDDIAELQIWLFGEMSHHLLKLQRVWPELEARLAELPRSEE